MPKKTDTNQLGTITDDAVYPLPVFERISGLGKSAMAKARAQGLKVRKTNGRAYVLGKDFSSWLASLDESPQA